MKARRTITLEVEAETQERADALLGDWYRDVVVGFARTPSLGQYTVYPIAPALVIVDAARHVIDGWEAFDGHLVTDRLEDALHGLRAALDTFDVLESGR